MIDPRIDDDRSWTDPSDRLVRQFAGLCGLLLGAAAARDIVRGASLRGSGLALLAVVVVAIGLARPQTVRPWFVAATAITIPVRAVVSTVLLGIMYYAIFTPIALVFRVAGRDALSRHRPWKTDTHWVPKETPTEVRSYFRQS